MSLGILVAGVFSLSSRPLSETVTYQTAGKSLSHICRDLRLVTGRNLDVSTDLGTEILAIDVHGVSVSTLVDKITEVTHGTWLQRKDRLLLTQDNGQRRKDERRHRELLVEAFQSSLQHEAKILSNEPSFDSNQAEKYAERVVATLSNQPGTNDYARRMIGLREQSPSQRAVRRLLASFDGATLAELPARIRVVYSNDPNSAQRSLPPEAMSAAQELVRGQTLWAEEANKAGVLALVRQQKSSVPSFLTDLRVPKGSPEKILVGLYRESVYGRVKIDVKVADRSGNVICQANASLTPKLRTAKVEGELPNASFPLAISEQELEMAPDGFLKNPASPRLRSLLTSPMSVDPLSIAYGRILLQISQQAGANLVADLSDQLLDAGLYNRPTCRQFLSLIADRGQGCRYTSGWITVAPQDFYFTHTCRANRNVLQEYVRGSVSLNFPVERQAACAIALPDPMDNFLPSELVSTLKRRKVGLQSIALLRFMGSLTDEDVQSASKGGGMRLAALSSTSLSAFNEMVNGETGTLIVKNLEGIMRDPSECLAGGLSPDAYFTLDFKSSPAVFDLSRDSQPRSMNQGSVSAGELAFSLYEKSHPDRFPPSSDQDSVDEAHFCLGTYKKYSFRFYLSPDVMSQGSLDGRSIDGNMLRMEDLPAQFRAEIEQQFGQITKDEMAYSQKSQGPRTRPAKP